MQDVSIFIAVAATIVGLVFAGLAVWYFIFEHAAAKQVSDQAKLTAPLVGQTTVQAANALSMVRQRPLSTQEMDAAREQAAVATAQVESVGEGAKGLAELAKALKDLRKSLQTAFISALFFLIATAAAVGQSATDAAAKAAETSTTPSPTTAPPTTLPPTTQPPPTTVSPTP
jgi:hypothetical protein